MALSVFEKQILRTFCTCWGTVLTAHPA